MLDGGQAQEITLEAEEVDVPYLWWDDNEYAKIMGQFRLRVGALMMPLRQYGQGPFVDGALSAIMLLADQMGQKLRGKDIPYVLPRHMEPPAMGDD